MNKAMLSQDYHDAGANRVVSVLEEIREGFLRKAQQAQTVADDTQDNRIHNAGRAVSETFKAAADDLAVFIQREQRHD